jgi:O-succinylbenzoic acid--CoA ligase
VIDWLERAAAGRPDAVALQRGDEQLTYASLLARARTQIPGVAPGERVPLAFADRLEFSIALHGCLLSGAAAVPIDLRLSAAEQALRSAPGRVSTPNTATVMYTSGTTAAPKPVELTVANWEANALGSAHALGSDPGERWLATMPLAHVGGLSILLRSCQYATTVVIHDGFDVDAVLIELMDPARAITLVSLVPTMLARLLDAGLAHPPTLRWALLGGGPIAPGLLARARSLGVPVAPTYGMTEACSQIATFGMPLRGIELSLNHDSEILVRGAVVAPGAIDADGWLHTGDLGTIDHDGRLSIIGRKADTVVSGGENIAPAEVEAVLLEHPAVADAAVFARGDPEWGEVVVAKVVLRDTATVSESELQEFCALRLARFKVPKAVELVAALPRTPTGKLLRRQLM